MVAGGAGEALGIGLDSTGVGAVAGVPLNVGSALVMAQGATGAAAGLGTLLNAMMSQGGGGGGRGGNPPKPPAKPPPAVKGGSEMARIMKWGKTTGGVAPDLTARTAELTREELVQEGVTLQDAEWWRDFYRDTAANNPNNPAAPGRYMLMQRAVELLGGT
jgi:hypothetical protein